MTAGAPPVPSRTGPVLSIILGTLMLLGGFLGGMAVAALSLLNSIDTSQLQSVNDGSTVNLNAGDKLLVLTGEGQTPHCTLTSAAGEASRSQQNEMTIHEIPSAGEYTVNCGTGGEVYLAPSTIFDELVKNPGGFATPALIGMLISFLGLILLIVGIVWLVRVNKRRRASIGQMQGQYGNYGGQPYGQPGYGQPPNYGIQPGYGQQPPYNQQPGFGQQQPPQSTGSSTDPFATPTEQPRYGDDPEPPRYGERIDPNSR